MLSITLALGKEETPGPQGLTSWLVSLNQGAPGFSEKFCSKKKKKKLESDGLHLRAWIPTHMCKHPHECIHTPHIHARTSFFFVGVKGESQFLQES